MLRSKTTIRNLSILGLTSIFLILTLSGLLVDSTLADEEAVWTDEFTTRNSRWEWSYNRGTGYKRLTRVDGKSAVEIGITDQSSSLGYSDCSLHETSHQYTYGIFEARLRCTDDNGFNQPGQGTRGWGFWHWEDDPLKLSAAWFWSASPESDASVAGFQVMVARDSTVVFQESLPEIDMREWHIYRVELLPGGTRFLVDGNEVAFARNKRPNRLQRIEMWIDNYRVQVVGGKVRATGYLNVQQDQQLYIDWVKYYDYSNRPPVADNQSVTTSEDNPVSFTLTASDDDGDPLEYIVVTDPENGLLSDTAPDLTYAPNLGFSGTDSFTFKANDGTADSNVATVTITVNPGADCVVDTDCDDGLFCTGEETCDAELGCQAGSDPCPGQGCDEENDQCVAGPTAQLESGAVEVGGDYMTVNLTNSYVSPVVVCSVQYNNNTTPVVVRVSEVTSTSFDLRLQNPSGDAVSEEKENVSYLVVEEGVWTIDDVNIEAHKYLSTVTDENNRWVGQTQNYGQIYTSPVVVGQVMTENDPDWSVFWCQGSSRTDPPSSTLLKTGKTVCEDTVVRRADETIGFIVIEKGHGSIGGVEYEAALGGNSVGGVGNSPPYTYNFHNVFGSAPQVALVTLAGVNGINGGWAYLYGPTLATNTDLYLSIDEDQIGDSERQHISEQVGYVVFEKAMVYPAAPDCEIDTDCDDGLYCNGVETCEAGVCQSGIPVDCDDGVGCTDDTCNESADSCDNIADDAYCDDGLWCNGAETCDAVNGCQAGTIVDCDDGVGCTDDTCNEATDSCDNVADDAYCDNGLFCDGAETCDAILDCQPGTDPCLGFFGCDENNNKCFECEADHDCDDGLWCNGKETCDEGICQAGTDPCPGQLCDEDTDECVDSPNDQMHVNTIEVTKQGWWVLRRGIARVQIMDTEGSPVEGATVTGQWSDGANDTDQFSTGSDGWVTIYSNWRWGDATFTFCVTNVSKEGWDYDPDANVVTCGNTD